MVKIGTITFHASHNYGSMLQAFALQEFIKKTFDKKCEYKIINFVPPTQREVYKSLYDPTNTLKKKIQGAFLNKNKQDLLNKYEKFENFKNTKLYLTEEYTNNEELAAANQNFDFYIAGSDQIWNFNRNMSDFDWAYLLNFTNSQNKISYATSMGPKNQNHSAEKEASFKKLINKFKYISVRDEATQNFLKSNFSVNSEVLPDPCLLLTKEEWLSKLKPDSKIIDDDYIFLYHFNNKEAAKIANKIHNYTNLPIVVSQAPNKLEVLYKFKRNLDVGPVEFLSLVQGSKFVLTTSLHACIFSLIFNKNFFAINGLSDYRIASLLKHYNLEEHNMNHKNFKIKINSVKGVKNEVFTLINKDRAEAKRILEEQIII